MASKRKVSHATLDDYGFERVPPQRKKEKKNQSIGHNDVMSAADSKQNHQAEAEVPVHVSPPKAVNVAVIGTAGRGASRHLMTRELYRAMVEKCIETIETRFGLERQNVHLVSGGAAWSDHVAVDLFLSHSFKRLTIVAPCGWSRETPAAFVDTGASRWQTNPGKMANACHSQFSKATGKASLAEIEEARQRGAVVDSSHLGFHKRNTAIAAKAQYMIAFTWATGSAPPKTGGSADTWKKSKIPDSRKHHISLASL